MRTHLPQTTEGAPDSSKAGTRVARPVVGAPLDYHRDRVSKLGCGIDSTRAATLSSWYDREVANWFARLLPGRMAAELCEVVDELDVWLTWPGAWVATDVADHPRGFFSAVAKPEDGDEFLTVRTRSEKDIRNLADLINAEPERAITPTAAGGSAAPSRS